MESIKPYVIKINEYNTVGQPTQAAAKWAVDLEVVVGDKNLASRYKAMNPLRRLITKHTLNEMTGRIDGSLGRPIFFLVCSREYVHQPDKAQHSVGDIKKAFIQDTYNAENAEGRIQMIVNDAPVGPIGEVEEYLGQYFDITPWED